MGEAVIEGSNWKLVEVGRVVSLNDDHPYAGRLGAIVEIVDHKRVRSEQRHGVRDLLAPGD